MVMDYHNCTQSPCMGCQAEGARQERERVLAILDEAHHMMNEHIRKEIIKRVLATDATTEGEP